MLLELGVMSVVEEGERIGEADTYVDQLELNPGQF